MESSVLYGKPGVLAYDPVEDKVQCHMCGRWFVLLDPHLRWKHNLTSDEYREDFELNRTQPLCTPSLSEKHSRHFVAQGLVGKHLCFTLSSDFPHATGRRLQGRINFSRARTGLRLHMTEKRKQAQRLNYQMTLVSEPCVDCGTMVLVHRIKGRSAVCPTCRPGHKREYNRRYAEDNRERLREYMRDYDRNRRHRVKTDQN